MTAAAVFPSLPLQPWWQPDWLGDNYNSHEIEMIYGRRLFWIFRRNGRLVDDQSVGHWIRCSTTRDKLRSSIQFIAHRLKSRISPYSLFIICFLCYLCVTALVTHQWWHLANEVVKQNTERDEREQTDRLARRMSTSRAKARTYCFFGIVKIPTSLNTLDLFIGSNQS